MSETVPQADANTQASVGAQSDAAASTLLAEGDTSASTSSGSPSTSQQAPEGQSADGQAADAPSTEGDKAAEGDKPAGAPEKYEFKAPQDQRFDEQVIEAYSTVAKELDLPQDAAQKILDVIAPKVAERFAARQLEAMDKTMADWQAAAKSDKEYGGDKFDENLAVAKKALDAFGTPELRKLLGPYDAQKNPGGTGLGNNPEIIRAFIKAGKAISEDKFVPGGRQPSKGETNAAKALYPQQS